MLHALVHVDWSKLSHAQGAADDLPSLLRSVERGDSYEREEACRELLELLCPNGEVFSATAPALPFVYELLGCVPTSQDRENLLWLLASAARGIGASQDEVRAAVAIGVEQAFGWLRDPHPRVRLHAALVCAVVPTRPVLAQVLAQAVERERALDVRVGLSLSLAVHGVFAEAVYDSDDDDLPLDRLEPVVRRAARGQRHAEVIELLAALASEGLDEALLEALEAPQRSM